MNRTYSININGRVYIINDDAYELLNDYLRQLSYTFPGAEGMEIVADIETRIADLFDEALAADHRQVINLVDVRNVIATMGRPEDISGESAPDNDRQRTECNNTSANSQRADEPTPRPVDATPRKRLYRSTTNKVFGGVFGGLATYLGWDATIMRILYVVLMFVLFFWPLFFLYFIAWMVIPQANTPRRILEQNGRPVTVGNVGQTVLEATPPPYDGTETATKSESFSVLSNVVKLLGKTGMAIIGFVSSIGVLGCSIFLIMIIVGLCMYFTGNGTFLLDIFDLNEMEALWGVSWAMPIAIIPLIAITWAACSVVFGCKGASKSLIITAVVLEVLFIATLVIGEIIIDNLPHQMTELVTLASKCEMHSYANAAPVYGICRMAV